MKLKVYVKCSKLDTIGITDGMVGVEHQTVRVWLQYDW